MTAGIFARRAGHIFRRLSAYLLAAVLLIVTLALFGRAANGLFVDE